MRNTRCLLFGGALFSAGLAADVSASVSFVASRGALGGTDFVDWGQFGPEAYSFVGIGLTDGGVGFYAKDLIGYQMYRADQGSNWMGNFAPGDRLAYTQANKDNWVQLWFDTPTDRVGANVQPNVLGGFNGYIWAFDAYDTLLGAFDVNGNSTQDGDGSALFLGVQSTGFDISHIIFGVGANNIAINQVDVNFVPAPGSAGALCVCALAARRRRPRRS